MKYYLLTAFAMLAFAANSILCRLALAEAAIDAASFTSLRLLSGAVMMAAILVYQKRGFKAEKINTLSVLMLFLYAFCFSFSYINISAGSGALILFASVQLSMMVFALFKGERPGKLAWCGIVLAFSGLVYLLLPGISAPPLSSALLMMLAGIAWGIYSLRGKQSKDAISSTGWNFIGTVPLALITFWFFHAEAYATAQGIMLAIASGALASSVGYVVWYSVLPYMAPTQAATIQLSVPVIAAFAGALLLSESITLQLVLASVILLGGIYLTIRPVREN